MPSSGQLQPERVDIGEVADPREAHDTHGERPVPSDAAVHATGGEVQRVLRVEPHIGAPRQDAVRRASGQLGQPVDARFQQAGIAAELVDDESGDEALVGGIQQHEGPAIACQSRYFFHGLNHSRDIRSVCHGNDLRRLGGRPTKLLKVNNPAGLNGNH